MKPTVNRLVVSGGALLIFTLGVCRFSPAIAEQVTPDFKQGYWRVAILMTVPNASGPSTGPAQFDRCMDPKNIQGLLMMPPNAPCTVNKSQLKRDSLVWQMNCDQGGFNTVANGKMYFKGTRLEGEIKTVARGPETIHITTNIEGRYLGPCVNISTPSQGSKPSRLKRFED